MSLNGYSWVEGNTPNATDPSGRYMQVTGCDNLPTWSSWGYQFRSLSTPIPTPSPTPSASSYPSVTPTGTPTAVPTSLPTGTITPTPQPLAPTPMSPHPQDPYRLVLGVRGDVSGTYFAGADINVEFQVIPRNAAPVNGEWRPLFVLTWNPGLEFSDPGVGFTGGVIFGTIRDSAIGQNTAASYTGGLNIVPIVGPMIEGDLSISSDYASIVGFLGVGLGADTPVSGYAGTSSSAVLFSFNPIQSIVSFFRRT